MPFNLCAIVSASKSTAHSGSMSNPMKRATTTKQLSETAARTMQG
ncbi:hypothetical protein ACJ73_10211 [Blastomyces percursus]|uniref:Uncharacterized protein n=1 Tax=Blastomyces percursus TaxID=1658174 RepID=A0A1J9P155_9EURO|nr:hypothetical protein ACJ73_10211 [Blastomyces percursus]